MLSKDAGFQFNANQTCKLFYTMLCKLENVRPRCVDAFFRVNLCHITILTMVLLETVKFQTIASRNNNNKTINETHLHS